MAKRYKSSADRNQLSFQLLSFEDMIPSDTEVRAIDVIVDKLDISSLGFTYSETKSTGRMPYNPVDMFKLYVYSYFNGIRSSRKIERECHRNIELMWLLNGLMPDFKTIADFRKNNKEPIKHAFQKFNMICCELGLIGKEIVAVDGSKFRASNSRMAYHSKAKIEKKMEHHNKMAEQYLKILESCDNEESATPKFTKEELVERIEKAEKRLVELSVQKREVIENGTIYDTDRDSRMMKTNNNGNDICHNVQIAVDCKNHLVVAVDVTSQAVDKEQFHNIALQAKENLDVNELTVIADKGYYSALQFMKCSKDNIKPIVARVSHAHMAATNEYGKEAFVYDEDSKGYICPQGNLLSPFKSKTTSKYKDYIRYANPKACRECEVKEKFTTGKYRLVQDIPYQEFAREVDKHTEWNKDMYYQRKQLVEHPFGTIKRSMGFSYFLTRGNDNVRAESVLHFFVYNLKRVINIIGSRKLTEVLQG